MNAPVTIRGGRWRALTGILIDLLPDAAVSRSHCLPAAGEVTAQVNVPLLQARTTPPPAAVPIRQGRSPAIRASAANGHAA
jgi:hypothetical protein